jgi:hypothetical protein
LANALVELIEHRSVSRDTVRRRLGDNDLKPWQKSYGGNWVTGVRKAA